MHDTRLLAAALSMVDQPVAVSKKDRIAFMNTGAIELAGRDLTGKPTALLIPSYIMNTQADNFAATAFIGTKNCSVKVNSFEGTRFYVMVCNEQSPDDREALYTSLRTTLSNIKFATSCVSIIAEDEGNEKLLEYVCSLNRSYYRMKRVLSNVTALNALARGQMPFNAEAVDVTALCKNMIDEVMSLGDIGVTINFNAPERIRIVADRMLLQQLLLNLLSNSIDHCPHNGRVYVSLLRTDKNLILSVDDSGDGIPQEELSYAFERYKHEADLTKPQGAGMGLAVVRGIAELHKGAVIIESRGENMGTSVRVMLSLDIPMGTKKMSARRPDYDRENLRLILSEMSYCLPLECFSELMED